MLNGLLSIIHPNQLCEGCLMRKQFCKSFSKEFTSRANQHLQEIHANVCALIYQIMFVWSCYKETANSA